MEWRDWLGVVENRESGRGIGYAEVVGIKGSVRVTF